ncbi:MAG: hypothetical protein QXD66_07260 [Candidatus Nezhaarchaeales archaeon]|nr:MAG: VapB-type antitoxin [Candidatus Nezhaarchaeota archaeon WYZ-LMO8]TDA35470.1 MAG: VapB-type antitoxin [Candidatus Nezhaarchaeota archaeon WYZ-LMO7]
MGKPSAVISVRVREEVKRILEKSGIDVGEVVRRFLEELAWKVKIRDYVSRWDDLLKNVRPSEKGFSMISVREDRESH